MGRNYLLADIEGRGHYVGTVQSVQNMSAGWYGEGDDFFFIDGETEPRLRGTGTEDYFCDGWGFRQHDGPFYGVPLWEGYDGGQSRHRSIASTSRTRCRSRNRCAWRSSTRARRTSPTSTGSGFIERDDLMSSVAFWYQATACTTTRASRPPSGWRHSADGFCYARRGLAHHPPRPVPPARRDPHAPLRMVMCWLNS